MLRFFGYFKEAVVESRLENYRIRKLLIYYYLEDHSILINEPKQVNSGTPQGIFLKRQMVLKEDGSSTPLMPFDFRIGADVMISGRSVRIKDCDQYTREFFDVRYFFLHSFFDFNSNFRTLANRSPSPCPSQKTPSRPNRSRSQGRETLR